MTSAKPKIFIASDHGGFALKTHFLKEFPTLIDLGCLSSEAVDYPDFAKKLCKEIKEADFGILICGSGVGMSIAANRFKNIRAALCMDEKTAELARAHNDANVICLGERLISKETALAIVKKFLATKFEGQRHEARVKKLSE
jgi:ribose 5-phosphate isomerase B